MERLICRIKEKQVERSAPLDCREAYHPIGRFIVASTCGPAGLLLMEGQPIGPMLLSADDIDRAMGISLEDLIAGTEIEVSEGVESISAEGLLQDFPGLLPRWQLWACVVRGVVRVGLIWFGLIRRHGKKTT